MTARIPEYACTVCVLGRGSSKCGEGAGRGTCGIGDVDGGEGGGGLLVKLG